MGQFSGKFPVDPNIPAAGIPNLPTKGYSVIEHRYIHIIVLYSAGYMYSHTHTHTACSVEGPDDSTASGEKLQGVLQQRNYLKNVNPRDPLNVNLRKAFLEYDKDLYVNWQVSS